MPRERSRPDHPDDDARLVALAAAGDQRAFEALVRRYERELLARCRRVLRDDRAEDALQQALLAAWRALSAGAEVQHPRAWLHRIAERSAVRLAQRPQHEDELALDAQGAHDATPFAELERRRLTRDVLASVAALPADQQQALVGVAVHERPARSVARDLDVTEGAVRQLVFRARAAVRAAAAGVLPLPWLQRLFVPVTPAEASLAGAGAGAGAVAVKVAIVVAAAGGVATAIPAGHGARDAPARAGAAVVSAAHAGHRPAVSGSAATAEAGAAWSERAGRLAAAPGASARGGAGGRAKPARPRRTASARRHRPGGAPGGSGGPTAANLARAALDTEDRSGSSGQGRGRGRGRGGDEDEPIEDDDHSGRDEVDDVDEPGQIDEPDPVDEPDEPGRPDEPEAIEEPDDVDEPDDADRSGSGSDDAS